MNQSYASIVIVGGKGMLAHALGQSLQQRQLPFVSVDLPEYDITRPESVRKLFAQHKPTLLFNCAAHTKVDLCEQEEQKANAINGEAVGLLAEAAQEYRTRLVHISTDFVFDGTAQCPYRVSDEPHPMNAYGRSKLLGEQKLQAVNPEGWIIARTAWLYGPQGFSFPRTMVERAKANQPLQVVGDQSGSPTYTFDLAAGLLELIDHDASGLFHVTNSGQTTWYEFARATLEAFGLKTELSAITTAEYQAMRPQSAARPAYSVLDGSAFAQAAGHAMRPWREGLIAFREITGQRGGF